MPIIGELQTQDPGEEPIVVATHRSLRFLGIRVQLPWVSKTLKKRWLHIWVYIIQKLEETKQ